MVSMMGSKRTVVLVVAVAVASALALLATSLLGGMAPGMESM